MPHIFQCQIQFQCSAAARHIYNIHRLDTAQVECGETLYLAHRSEISCRHFSHLELLYELSCRFHSQTSVQLLQGDTEAVLEPASEVEGCSTATAAGPWRPRVARPRLLHRHLRETPRPHLASVNTQ